MMNKEISKIKAQWDIAYNLVTDLFKDKVDKGGHPYIGHLLRVYRNVENEKNKKCSDPAYPPSSWSGTRVWKKVCGYK